MASVVLMGDPSVASIPVDECGEPLEVAGSDFTMSTLKEVDDPYRSRLRGGVRSRLMVAQSHLPPTFRICWVEGHRDARLQERYFTNYHRHLRKLDRSLDDEASYLGSRELRSTHGTEAGAGREPSARRAYGAVAADR